MRTLALCADDFGLSAAVNQGILQLARRGRLTAVSCMANGPAWAAGAAELKAVAAVREGSLRLGLHFNLTEGRPLSPALARVWPRLPSLPRLLLMAHLWRLPLGALRQELDAQWLAFEAAIGRAPDHIDGHQHVHHLPGLRDLVLERVACHAGLRVRATGFVQGPGFGFKRHVIMATGGITLQRALLARQCQLNSTLLGVHDFQAADYRPLMQGWLAGLPQRGALIFCHPGQAADEPGDAIADARPRELAYLDSDAFLQDLARADTALNR